MTSDAIGQERVSRTVGYNIKRGNFGESSQNLPQRLAIFAEANHDNQGTLDVTPKEITSAKQAGELYGYGSPIHMIIRILRSFSSEGVGGIPTFVYPQEEAIGATAKVIEATVTGVANGNGTHYLKIAGRDNIDGQVYALAIEDGDTAADIYQKIEDVVNAVLGCPMTADSTQYEATLTSKWKGLTANEITMDIDTGDDDLGLEYLFQSVANGAGTPSIADALEAFGNVWNTRVLNGYGTVSSIMDALEAFNGIPKDLNPTGRYQGTTWKPFIAYTGSTSDDPSAITDARKAEVTIALCPAPASDCLSFEAAANYAYLELLTAQNNPHLDVQGQALPDMDVPTDGNIGSMADYNNRDSIVKKGCSTVDLVNNGYEIQDLVTTYHPVGEAVPQYRYVRDLNLDMNVRFGYLLLERAYVLDHVIANDGDTVTAFNTIKPKQWKSVLADYAKDLAKRGLIVDPDFMIASITVNVSPTNPNRFETFFRYKRSGVVRQSATTAEAGFNYGTLNA